MYYPLSQITPNLYTATGDYLLAATGEVYTGDYYSTSDGKYFSGKTPQDGPNNPLIPNNENNAAQDVEAGKTGAYTTEETNISYLPPAYIGAIGSPISNASSPMSSIIFPTKEEYDTGEYQRYFLKKNNELKYMEIDVDTYNNYLNENPNTQYQLYTPSYLNWNISGNPIDVYKVNKNLAKQTSTNLKWYGFEEFFKLRFCKFYKSSTPNYFYTNGNELKLVPTGENYVGYYHVHSNRGVMMEGKFHKPTQHSTLIPFVGGEEITKIKVSLNNEVGTSIRKNISRKSGY